MSVSKAIWIGLLVVNGPVLIFLVGPLLLFSVIVDRGMVSRDFNWVGLVVFIGGFVLAWLWWSLSVPKWRLWAYQRVVDIPALKRQAVDVGLTWPDNHVFGRTEIKSSAHEKLERELDSVAINESDCGEPADLTAPKRRS